MRNAQSDAAGALIEKILCVEHVNHVDTEYEFLILWQENNMGQRQIVRGIRIEVRAIRFTLIHRGSQSGPVQHLARQGRMFSKSIARDGRAAHELRVIAEDGSPRIDIVDLLLLQ